MLKMLFAVKVPANRARFGREAGAVHRFYELNKLETTYENGVGEASWFYSTDTGRVETASEILYMCDDLIQEAYAKYLSELMLS